MARTDREGLRRLLAEHEDLVSPIVLRYHGRVVKNLGDSFMCLFESATDALRAALEIQDYVTQGDAQTLRIGMATGDVEEIAGDAFGDAVNRAARVLSKTPASECWFGPATLLCMNAAETPWESVGRFTLKGIPGEPELLRAVPANRCWLPEAIKVALKTGRLVRVKRGIRPDQALPPDPVVILEGFAPGSAELVDTLKQLPVLDPASLWLLAYHISTADRHAWTSGGRSLVVGSPKALDIALHDANRVSSRSSGTDTIVLDVGNAADMELVVAGIALPVVPMSQVVSSYSYDLLPDGRWVNHSERAMIRVEVVAEGPRMLVSSPGVSVDGKGCAPGAVVPLDHGMLIRTPYGVQEYRAADGGYFGVILGDGPVRLGVSEGQAAEMGREPNHPGLAFPDRRGQGNIQWCSGARAERAKSGGFTLDRALAGRRQASVVLVGDEVEVTPLHPRCPTFVLGERGLRRVIQTTKVPLGESVVVGTTVVGLRPPE